MKLPTGEWLYGTISIGIIYDMIHGAIQDTVKIQRRSYDVEVMTLQIIHGGVTRPDKETFTSYHYSFAQLLCAEQHQPNLNVNPNSDTYTALHQASLRFL